MGLVQSLKKSVVKPMSTSVVLRMKLCKICKELAPDAPPTHSSGNEHVCTRLVQL